MKTPLLPVEIGVGEARALIDLSMSEAMWQAQIVEFATRHGWHSWHDNDARMNDASFPDLVLWRERLIFVECKKMGGKLSVDRMLHNQRTGLYFRKGQVTTLAELRAAGQEVYVWYPNQWGEVVEVLTRQGRGMLDGSGE